MCSWFVCSGSIGFMQATPGAMKSLRSSAERMADIAGFRESVSECSEFSEWTRPRSDISDLRE